MAKLTNELFNSTMFSWMHRIGHGPMDARATNFNNSESPREEGEEIFKDSFPALVKFLHRRFAQR